MTIKEKSLNIDDGGERIAYGTGAIREPSTGKGRFDLITPYGLRRLAIWYELGAQKYSDRNWEKGVPLERCLDSALRHLNKYMMHMEDEDHLAAAVWNIMAIMHFEEIYKSTVEEIPFVAFSSDEEKPEWFDKMFKQEEVQNVDKS